MLRHVIEEDRGPSTLLCGTLNVTAASSEQSPPTATLWDLYFSTSLIQSRNGSIRAFQGDACVKPYQNPCWSPWWLGYTVSPLSLLAITHHLVSAAVFHRSTLPWNHVASLLKSHDFQMLHDWFGYDVLTHFALMDVIDTFLQLAALLCASLHEGVCIYDTYKPVET